MKFSIIIPVYNDAHITQCLQSIAGLHYPHEQFEVIVVDNNSRQDIAEIVKNFPVHYVHEAIPGSYTARNAGAIRAQGDILVFTDSDCEVSADWLHAIENALTSDSVAAVMGYAGGNNLNKIAYYEQTMYEENIAAFSHETTLRRIDTRNFAIKREVFKQVGEFTAALAYGGDMEYGARVHEKGYSIIFSKFMYVAHTNPTNLHDLLSKRIRQNYGNMKIRELHTESFVIKYFPHLLRYRSSIRTRTLWWLLRLWIWLVFPFSHPACILLPGKLGYMFFKLQNIIAMRFGQLSYILGKSV